MKSSRRSYRTVTLRNLSAAASAAKAEPHGRTLWERPYSHTGHRSISRTARNRAARAAMHATRPGHSIGTIGTPVVGKLAGRVCNAHHVHSWPARRTRTEGDETRQRAPAIEYMRPGIPATASGETQYLGGPSMQRSLHIYTSGLGRSSRLRLRRSLCPAR